MDFNPGHWDQELSNLVPSREILGDPAVYTVTDLPGDS